MSINDKTYLKDTFIKFTFKYSLADLLRVSRVHCFL